VDSGADDIELGDMLEFDCGILSACRAFLAQKPGYDG